MLTLCIMIVAAAVAGFFTWTAGEGGHWAWAILAALGAAIAALFPINLWISKRLNAIFTRLQAKLAESQETIRRKAAAMQNRGIGGPKAIAMLEKEQNDAVRAAIAPLDDEVRPLRKWNLLAQRQANMLKGTLLFQIKDYDGARPLLEKFILVNDPTLVGMQMVLHYKQDPAETTKLDAMFNKGIGRFKYEQGTLLYALYSWLLVKQKRISEAVAVLDEGKKKTEDPVIAQNWENLVNNRLSRFSFVGLGEKWFALGLETPPVVRQRAQMPFGGGRPARMR